MKFGFSMSAALLLIAAAPAPAQTVRAGIEAWQKGQPEVAVTIWAPLAAKGDADAAFNLGQAYRLGKGVPLDLGRAQLYLEQAARKNHLDAATTLGILLFQNGNRTAAIRWLRQAADSGEARAMLLYGTALYNGDGTAPDVVRAYAYVSRAAAQGLAAGRATLADLDAAMPLEQRHKGIELARTMVGKKSAAELAPAEPAATKPAPVASPETRPLKVAVARDGNWRVQLGAFAQHSSAMKLFARLSGKLGGADPILAHAGNIVRLQAGPFASRSAAAAACARVAPQPCFPVEAP